MITASDRALAWLTWRRSRVAFLGALAVCVAIPLALATIAALGVDLPGRNRPLTTDDVVDLSEFLLGLLVFPVFSGILGGLGTPGWSPARDSWLHRQPLARSRTWLVRTVTGLVLTTGVFAAVSLVLSALDLVGFDQDRRMLLFAAAVMGVMGFGAGLLGGTLAGGALAGLVALGYWGAVFGAAAAFAPAYPWMVRPMLALLIAGFGATALLATLAAQVRAEPLGKHRTKVALAVTAASLLLLFAGFLPGAAAIDRLLLPAEVPCETAPVPSGDVALLRFFRFDGSRSWVVDTRAAERVLSLAPGHAEAAAHPRRPWLALAMAEGLSPSRSGVRVVVLEVSERRAREVGSWSWTQALRPQPLRWVGDRLVTIASRPDDRFELVVFEAPFTAAPRRLLVPGRRWVQVHGGASADEVTLVTRDGVRGVILERFSLVTGSVVGDRLPGVPFSHFLESPLGQRIAGSGPHGVAALDLASGVVAEWPVGVTGDPGPSVIGNPVWLDDEHLAWVVRRGSLACVDMARIPDPAVELTCWMTDRVRLWENPLSGKLIANLSRGNGEASVFDLASRRWQDLPPGRMYSWAGRETLAVQTTTGGIGFAELATPDDVRWLQRP